MSPEEVEAQDPVPLTVSVSLEGSVSSTETAAHMASLCEREFTS